MIHQGHCIDVLRRLPSRTMHCVVTSPPYWSLRDYGVPATVWGGSPACVHSWGEAAVAEGFAGKRKWQHGGNGPAAVTRSTEPEAWAEVPQGATCDRCGAWCGCLGLEPTPELYVHHLVQVFDEVRRVLRDDGTLWLNLGDCYAAGGRGGNTGQASGLQGSTQHQEESKKAGQRIGSRSSFRRDRMPLGDVAHKAAPAIKPKDMVGIPWMVAFALRAQGWYLRSDIIWAKTNPMPESIKDRPTKSHEYLFLLAKSEGYYYDADAIRETYRPDSLNRVRRQRSETHKYAGGGPGNQRLAKEMAGGVGSPIGRNRRSVWTLPTAPFPGAHFATFPQRLVEPCILAGTSEHGCCSACGAPFRRVLKLGAELREQKILGGCNADGEYHGKAKKNYQPAGAQDPSAVKARILAGMVERITVRWDPTCRCSLRTIVPCRVLDPFAGAATTAVVADRLGRDFIGVELNPDYVAIGESRRQPRKVEASA